MQQTDSVFSYLYARKTPTITYKRKQQTYGDSIPRPLTPVTAISTSPSFLNALSSTQPYASPTELTPISTDDEKENSEIQSIVPTSNHQQPELHTIDLALANTTAKDIFDLSDDDNNGTQVEIRVASSLHFNNKTKTKPTNTNSHSKATNKKTPKTPSKPTANPSGIHHQKRNNKQTNTKTPPSFARTLSAPAPATTSAKTTTPLPVARNMSMLPRLPDTKRRKRNLVSQLKAANGERPDISTQPGGNRFYDVASDDDADIDGTFDAFNQNDDVSTERAHNIVPPCRSASTPSAISTEPTTCSNDYNDRMEQELAELMRTEFGQDGLVDDPTTLTPSSSSSSSQRGCYVPENTIRAPVTYKRVNNNGNKSATSLSSNIPLSELDQEMEQQIQYLLSGEF